MKTVYYTKFWVLLLSAFAVLPSLSSCREECSGKPPVIRVINRCTFDMDVEIDVIGGDKYLDTLEYMESISYDAHETKVSIKFRESAPLITFSRTKNIQAKSCWQYNFEIIPNDSSVLYDFDVRKDRNYNT